MQFIYLPKPIDTVHLLIFNSMSKTYMPFQVTSSTWGSFEIATLLKAGKNGQKSNCIRMGSCTRYFSKFF